MFPSEIKHRRFDSQRTHASIKHREREFRKLTDHVGGRGGGNVPALVGAGRDEGSVGRLDQGASDVVRR